MHFSSTKLRKQHSLQQIKPVSDIMISSELRAREESDFKRETTSKSVPTRLSFKPLPLSVFQKELEEARNEPLPAFNISNSESETDDTEQDVESHTDLQEEKENESSFLKLQNSCDSLPSIPEEDMVDTQEKENIFIKPANNQFDKFRTPAKTGNYFTPSSLKHDKFVTTPRFGPKSTTKSQELPKIQYTISTDLYLNTPLTKMSMLKRTPEQASKLNLYRPMSTQRPLVKRSVALQERNYNGGEFENAETAEMDGLNEKKQVEGKRVKLQEDAGFNVITVKGVDYTVLSQLGMGGSSVVWNCFDPTTKTMCAIKRVNLTGDKSLVTGYINEVKLLEKLQKCDRIIRLFSYEIIESEKVLLMVLEKGDADLSKILKDLSSKSDRLPTFKLVYYWMEMLYAVKEIHDNDVIHSDLKPANFLQLSSGLKLIDFGIASCIQSDMTSVIKNVPVGSFNYISPEALSSDNSGASSPKYKVSFKSDVWSLGCILYQLVYRRTPFQHIGHPYAKMMAIADPKQQIKYPEAEGVPSFIINTIKLCLQHDMKSRPSVQDLIEQMEEVFQFK